MVVIAVDQTCKEHFFRFVCFGDLYCFFKLADQLRPLKMNENGRIEKGPTEENKIDFIITILFSPPSEIQHFFSRVD